MIARAHLLSCCAALAHITADPVLAAVRLYADADGDRLLWSDRFQRYLRLLDSLYPDSHATLDRLAAACGVSLARVSPPRPPRDWQQAADERRARERAQLPAFSRYVPGGCGGG